MPGKQDKNMQVVYFLLFQIVSCFIFFLIRHCQLQFQVDSTETTFRASFSRVGTVA